MKAYPKYKDSGIDWLGEVPEHWDVIALGRATISIKNGTTADQNNYSTENYRVTRIETISSGTINYDKTGFVEYSPSLDNYKLNNGDILFSHINSMEYVGNCAIYEMLEPMYSGMNLLRIVPANFISPKYLLYWLKSSGMKFEIQRNSKPAINQVSIPIGYVKSLPTLLQPFSEQQAIAAYLDDATTRIDALIEKKEQMIELLKEKRIALITHAVTKGLDPNVKMKDSGIEWLGEVPEHWEIIRSDAISNHIKNQVNPIDLTSDIVYHYSIPNVQETGAGAYEQSEELESSKQLISKQVILISKLNPRKATICIASPKDIITVCSTEFVILDTNNHNIHFLYYQLNSEMNRQRLDARVQSVTRSHQRVNPADIHKFWIASPLLTEQNEIVSFLENRTSHIDSFIQKQEQMIELLHEYRSSLIHHAVTGKIDLRGYHAKTH